MYDALTIAAIVDELNTQLVGGRIQQIAHVDPMTVALEVYASHQRRWLVLSADHERARALIHEERVGVDPERVTPILLLLRKYARGGRIVRSLSLAGRIIRSAKASFGAKRRGWRRRRVSGELVHSELIIEIMGRRSNIMLVEASARTIRSNA
jgi:predicted ribosome quality control (RQC) complex YloA/Tae2 family protein